jgi:hypothetical protein
MSPRGEMSRRSDRACSGRLLRFHAAVLDAEQQVPPVHDPPVLALHVLGRDRPGPAREPAGPEPVRPGPELVPGVEAALAEAEALGRGLAGLALLARVAGGGGHAG